MNSSHDDIRELIENLLEQEEMVFNLYRKLIDTITNEKVKGIIRPIITDEARHIENAKEMLRITKE